MVTSVRALWGIHRFKAKSRCFYNAHDRFYSRLRLLHLFSPMGIRDRQVGHVIDVVIALLAGIEFALSLE